MWYTIGRPQGIEEREEKIAMDFRPAITDVYNGKKLVVIGNLFVNDVFHGNGRPYAKVRISYFVPNAAIQDEQTKEKNKLIMESL